MAITKYSYTISTDTANAKVNSGKLTKDIQNSVILTSIDHIDTQGDVCDVWMKDILSTSSPDDATNLNNVLSVHDGNPLPDNTIQKNRRY